MTIYARKGQLVRYIGDAEYEWGGVRVYSPQDTALVAEDDTGSDLCLLHWTGEQITWRSLRVSSNWELVNDQV